MAREIDRHCTEVWLTCYSEATGISISCGHEVDYDSLLDINNVLGDLLNTLSEAYWENHDDFEDGIEVAERLTSLNKNLKIEQALFVVFEHFKFKLEINGQPSDYSISADPDKVMYALLQEG